MFHFFSKRSEPSRPSPPKGSHAIEPYLVRLYVEARHLFFLILEGKPVPPTEPFPVDPVRINETISRIQSLLQNDENLESCRRRFEKYFSIGLAHILGLAKEEPGGEKVRIEAAIELRNAIMAYIARHGADWNSDNLDSADILAINTLKESSRLQQQLAYLVNYTPNKWLLEQELPSILQSRARRERKPTPVERQAGKINQVSSEGLAATDLPGGDPFLWSRDKGRLSGLCMSGGGIRSATFNLGVLQGLAKRDLLRRFDYCSSVSGGGYIHQWLAAWIKREDQIAAQVDGKSGLDSVCRELIPLPDSGCGPDHPEPIRWLRRFSNYLTPRKGLFSADTWVSVAIWMRNTLLNQIILISMLFALIVAPHVFLMKGGLSPADLQAAQSGSKLSLLSFGNVLVGAVILGASVSLFLLVILLHKALTAAHDMETVHHQYHSDPRFDAAKVSWLIVLPALTLSLILSVFGFYFEFVSEPLRTIGLCSFTFIGMFIVNLVVTWSGGAPNTRIKVGLPFGPKQKTAYIAAAALSALLATVGILLARNLFVTGSPVHFLSVNQAQSLQQLRGSECTVKVTASSGSQVAVLLTPSKCDDESTKFGMPEAETDLTWRRVVAFGPFVIMFVHFVSIILQCGLIGPDLEDWVLEWLARVRALILIYSLLWAGICGITFFGRWTVEFLIIDSRSWIKWPVVMSWAATTIGSILAGRSRSSNGTGSKSESLLIKALIAVGPPTYMLGMLIGISWLVEKAIAKIGAMTSGPFGFRGFVLTPYVHGIAMSAIALVPILIVCIFGKRVSINQFSMHGYYRNRLARCYLGASNTSRNPDPISGFDAGDVRGLQLSNFAPSAGYSGPFPIFCASLNISTGEDLAWQERKAASFAFTPVLSGYHIPWTGHRYKGQLSYNGFVPTDRFAYRNGGIHISTVVAVSGAAVSPNWGYHTSGPMAFLLTMFNVRLGWWIANPRRSFLAFAPNGGAPNDQDEYPEPRFAPSLLIQELLGQVGDDREFVYLTDGGHFDNMGLYELVRRRCYQIVICDAEQDTGHVFEGIGMAIRKCRIDFGAEITLDLNKLACDAATKLSKFHWITGTIRYPETADEEKVGTILYIKSSVTGTEAADVYNFRLQNSAFPQDSTLDQWFSESQFESYRRLGQQVVDDCPYFG